MSGESASSGQGAASVTVPPPYTYRTSSVWPMAPFENVTAQQPALTSYQP